MQPFGWEVKTNGRADVTQYVDPFIGTAGHGHTFPGATSPFGMVQLSPDTRIDGSWDGCSGYHYSDSILYGFSHTHLSGTGCSDYGDILLMPYSKKACDSVAYKGYATRTVFHHADEHAEAGYYSVKLPNVKVELTASPHVGLHYYHFSVNDPAVELNLEHRDEVIESMVEIVNDTTVRGYRFSKAWAADQRVYFCLHFSKAVTATIYSDNKEQQGARSAKGKHLRVAFDAGQSRDLLVKAGISPVSEVSAENNITAEIPGNDFEAIRQKVKTDWNNELSRIEVSGGTNEQLRTFYTALYHCFTAPNLYSDVDGSYRGRDNQVHKDTVHPQYTVFSLWDTYRALHPLFTIVQQKRTSDFINTFIKEAEQGGRLPVWELSANETDCMIGYHSIPVIADAWVKGIRDYDAEKALNAMVHDATLDRRGLKQYKSCGYIPAEGEPESVSQTLEYGYDDWCIAQLAKGLHKDDIYKRFIKRAQAWQNMYDPKTMFMRARLNNAFVEPFNPSEVNFHYTEANAWQYNYAVPHDIGGLMQQMGGKENFAKHLDELFTASTQTSGREQADITGMIGQYVQGNEPSHHMAYLYCFADQPSKTQLRVAQIMHSLYTDKPDGLSGNEDCGQMSAWFVMSAMGMYAVTPGTDQYILGTPLFKELKIHLENGKTFTIKAPVVSDVNRFVNGVQLNGKEHAEGWITQSDIMNGGELAFAMGTNPLDKVDSKTTPSPHYPYKAPYTSISNDDRVPAAPRIVNTAARTFPDKLTLALSNGSGDDVIYYAIAEGPFMKYDKPVTIEKNTQLRTYAMTNKGLASDTVTSMYYRIPTGRKIKLLTKYAPQYAANGDNTLIDGLRGPENYMTGAWQGYEGVNLEAIIDLSSAEQLGKLSCGFLQDQNAWIFLPVSVEYFISNDGKTFTSAGKVANTVPDKQDGVILHDFSLKLDAKTRYIKVVATNMGKCPAWHKGAGNPSWIFTDELLIE